MIAWPRHIFSKSTFIRGFQCPKALCLHENQLHLRSAVSKIQQIIIDLDISVRKLAEQLFISDLDVRMMVTQSYQQSMIDTFKDIYKDYKVNYEVTIQYDCHWESYILDIKIKK